MHKFLFLLLFLCSCRVFEPQDWCAKNYPAQSSDSTYTKIEYVNYWDTIREPQYTILFDTILSISKDVKFHHEAKKGHVSSMIDIHNGKLKFECKSDSLEYVIEQQRKVITTFENQTKVITMPCVKEHKTKFNYFCSYFFWIVFSLLLIWLVLKAIKMYLKG